MQIGAAAYPGSALYPGSPPYQRTAYLLQPGDIGQPGTPTVYRRGSSLNYEAVSWLDTIDTLPVVYELDGLRFNEVGDQCLWTVKEVTGWHEAPTMRTNRSDKAGDFGSFRGVSFAGERSITLTGEVHCYDRASRKRAERRFAGLCTDGSVTHPLTVWDEDGSILTADVERDGKPEWKILNQTSATWQVTIAAPDPRKHDGRWQHRVAAPPRPSSGGMDFSGGGLDFSNGGLDLGTPNAPSIATVVNQGDAPIFPFLQFTGPAQVPVITARIQGVELTYGAYVEFGETITVNADHFPVFGYPPCSVTSDFYGDVYTYMTIIDWPELAGNATETYSIRATGTQVPDLNVWARSAWW